MLHKIISVFESKISSDEIIDSELRESYERLHKFIWKRSYIKKSIMTIPYNSSTRAMKKYLADTLVKLECSTEKTTLYSSCENGKLKISSEDLYLLISTLKSVIKNDFEKNKKLGKYLTNVAGILYALGLPITWTLPTGFTIKQSYLETKSTSNKPFTYSKTKINLKVSLTKYDKNKQVRSLMPNLIHSLDGTSLSLLYEKFSSLFNESKNVQLFSVHDCFGTTFDKVSSLKTLLASVYTDLYSSVPYLYKFDKYILDSIENATADDFNFNREKRTIVLKKDEKEKTCTIHDVEWVLNKKHLSYTAIKRIDSENILI